jgi:polar amino acid transport system permease protein
MPSGDIWLEWIPIMLQGLLVTVQLSSLSFVFTILLGSSLALLAVSEILPVRWLARATIDVVRSVPVLALMLFLYFGLGSFSSDVGLSEFVLAVFALSVSSASYLAEVYRGAILGVPSSQWRAATSLGLGHWKTLRFIVIPQVIPPLVPSTLNILISVIKLSALASLITVNELTLAGSMAVSLSFYPLHAYVLLGLMYASIIIPLIYLLRWMERWVRRRYGLVISSTKTGTPKPYTTKSKASILTGSSSGKE